MKLSGPITDRLLFGALSTASTIPFWFMSRTNITLSMLMLSVSPIIRIRSRHSIHLQKLDSARCLILNGEKSLKTGGTFLLWPACTMNVQDTQLKSPLLYSSALFWLHPTPVKLLLIFFVDRVLRPLFLQNMVVNLSPAMKSSVRFILLVAGLPVR